MMTTPRSTVPPPGAEACAHSARLVAHIAACIERADGWLPFDRYMELALYAPGLGYYAVGTHKLGDAASGGDFVTAPEISPLFGYALAAQVAQAFDGCAPCVLEFGAGTGALARDLLDGLSGCGVKVERYAIVEVSPDLQARQRALLAGRHVEWLEAPPSQFEGVVIANEVLDVMPVQIFVKRDADVMERGVSVRDGHLVLTDAPARAEVAAAVRAIEAEFGQLPDGYGSEIGLPARAWAASLGHWLKRGAVLLIDYGFPRREYYHPQRAMGTLMCHYRQHAHADPLWLPGLNDITAHVDFTAIAEAAHGTGMDVLGYTSQANFLLSCGLLNLVRDAHSLPTANRAQRLISEAEMGELFKVLALGRGIESALLGFVRGDRTHTL